MYTQIQIKWDLGHDNSLDGEMLTGHVSILDGEYINNIKPRLNSPFKIAVTKNTVTMKDGDKEWNMPSMSNEESMEVVDVARAYWDGRFSQPLSIKWIKIGQWGEE
jgi:hypothetical protein